MTEEEKNEKLLNIEKKITKLLEEKGKTNESTSDIDRFHKFYSDALTKILTIIVSTVVVVGILFPLLVQSFQWKSFKDESDDIQKEVSSDLERYKTDIKVDVDTRVVKAEETLRTLEQAIQKSIQDVEIKLFEIKASFSLNTDKIEDLTSFFDDALKTKDLRISRLEDVVKLRRPLTLTSPIALTTFGRDMLQKSGMNRLLYKYKSKLMEKVKEFNLTASPTIEEVGVIAKQIIDDYPDFDSEDIKMIDDYMFDRIEGRMFNLWELAGIRFRDMILEDLDIPEPTEIKVS